MRLPSCKKHVNEGVTPLIAVVVVLCRVYWRHGFFGALQTADELMQPPVRFAEDVVDDKGQKLARWTKLKDLRNCEQVADMTLHRCQRHVSGYVKTGSRA